MTRLAAGLDRSRGRTRVGSLKLRIIPLQFRLTNKFRQAKAQSAEFAEQQWRRDAVLVGLAVGIDHDYPSALAQRRTQPPEERVRLADLVVHVDQEDAVEAG